ncbi:MAG: hypothetical protein Edafosvirus2_60 [Edafosvirus sp.]|uniref:MORN-repeat protein n=1 Tax=Edafosvirus sp. TaxID=2487765 RepID=A0A3G4ZV64_9VIRU|nr:MAG: hypothetical protein Edafosvirus2_60 [Edafosvirus sp.]
MSTLLSIPLYEEFDVDEYDKKNGPYKQWFVNEIKTFDSLGHLATVEKEKGQLRIECEYKNGTLHGPYKELFADRFGGCNELKVKIKCTFDDGKIVGRYTEWDGAGALITDHEYTPTMRKEWYPSGHLKMECQIEDGKIHGYYKEWYDNELPKVECYYTNGILNGIYMRWGDSRFLQIKCKYENNLLHGEYKEWHQNGNIKIECNYKNGLGDGKYTSYYYGSFFSDPKKKYEWKYINGIKTNCKGYNVHGEKFVDWDGHDINLTNNLLKEITIDKWIYGHNKDFYENTLKEEEAKKNIKTFNQLEQWNNTLTLGCVWAPCIVSRFWYGDIKAYMRIKVPNGIESVTYYGSAVSTNLLKNGIVQEIIDDNGNHYTEGQIKINLNGYNKFNKYKIDNVIDIESSCIYLGVPVFTNKNDCYTWAIVP